MTPPHVSTFQRFADQIPNHLEASIAFGLFMESERVWAADQAGGPPDTKYRNYQKAVTNHDIGRFAQEARNFLNNFGNDAIAAKRAEFLQESLEQYEGAAKKGHSRLRGWGFAEAVIGAFVWTLVLIAISFVLKYNGIDLVEIYHKVAEH
jgi:hypothetical protein